MEQYKVTERLCKTEDGERLVPENHPEARWLYAIPGQQIPMAEAERFGLTTAVVVDDAPPADDDAKDDDASKDEPGDDAAKDDAGAKEQPKASDKARGKGRTK